MSAAVSAVSAALVPPVEEVTLPSTRRVGMASLILTESCFFGIFLTAYLFYIGKSLTPPYPADLLEIKLLGVPILGSACLFSSSLTVHWATSALRRHEMRTFTTWWLVTWALGFGFLTLTMLEWRELIYEHGFTIRSNLFGTTFYSLVGLHASHVIVGLFIIGLVAVLTMLGHVDARRHEEPIEMVSWYWHFVDGVWVVVLTTVYVIGR